MLVVGAAVAAFAIPGLLPQQQVADAATGAGAGDSDTDISFMVDSTEMRLVINRNKTELMCQVEPPRVV